MQELNRLETQTVDAAFKVHSCMGPGLLETVYEVAIEHELKKRGLAVVRQQPIPIRYDGLEFAEGFRADLVVENDLIIELKSVEKVAPVHKSSF